MINKGLLCFRRFSSRTFHKDLCQRYDLKYTHEDEGIDNYSNSRLNLLWVSDNSLLQRSS